MDEGIKTRNIYLAALVVSYGGTILSVDKTDSKRQSFILDRIPKKIFVGDETGNPELVSMTEDSETVRFTEIRSQFLSKKIYYPPGFVDCLQYVRSYLYTE